MGETGPLCGGPAKAANAVPADAVEGQSVVPDVSEELARARELAEEARRVLEDAQERVASLSDKFLRQKDDEIDNTLSMIEESLDDQIGG